MNKTKKNAFLLLFTLLLLTSCSPVNWFTRVKKIPREYSLNYCGGEIKAPKTDLNKEPWIVFSDRENNQTFNNAGGKVKAQDVDYLDPFLVIKKKGEFLRLIKYTSGILKNGKLEYKKAEYYGWIHQSKLLLNQQSVTDISSGKKNKMLVVFSDTTAINEPEKYFVPDSVKVFKDPELNTPIGGVSPYSVVYQLKVSDDGFKTLIAKKPYLKAGEVKSDILGWVDNSLIKDIGAGLHANLSHLPDDSLWFFEKNGRERKLTEDIKDMLSLLTEQHKTLKYNPVSSFSVRDDLTAFRTRMLIPLFDLSDNYIFNVNGGHITHRQYRSIARELRKINISFVLEGKEEVIARFPQIVNALQNMQDLFEQEDAFSFRFNCVMSFDEDTTKSVYYTDFTPDYSRLINSLSDKTNRKTHLKPLKNQVRWPALQKAVALLDNHRDAVNLIVLIGETGYATEGVDSTFIRHLSRNNCRIAGFQVYGGESDDYNNFVLDVEQMINAYAEKMLTTKKELLVTPGQVKKENYFKELEPPNTFRLDFPDKSITQGFLFFPKKGESLPMEILPNYIDTLLQQIKSDNNDVLRQIGQSFNSAGNNRTKYDSLFISNFGLAASATPAKKFISSFPKTTPGWYLPSKIVVLDDSLNRKMDYRLMLSEREMKELKEFVQSLSAVEVDLKYRAEEKKQKQKKTCNCPEDDLFAELETGEYNWNDSVSQEYASTRGVRKNIYKQYLNTIKYCKLCKEKGKRLKSLTFAEAHRRITGCPTSNEFMNAFRLKDIKKKKKIPDKLLDDLVNYFIKMAGELEKSEKFESNGETYYWVK
jgi:hypothetical protein